MEIYVIFTLEALFAVVEIIHYIERRDMLDRLMSRSVGEYKAVTDKKPEKQHESASARAMRLNSRPE